VEPGQAPKTILSTIFGDRASSAGCIPQDTVGQRCLQSLWELMAAKPAAMVPHAEQCLIPQAVLATLEGP
jgi:hypothetical protein